MGLPAENSSLPRGKYLYPPSSLIYTYSLRSVDCRGESSHFIRPLRIEKDFSPDYWQFDCNVYLVVVGTLHGFSLKYSSSVLYCIQPKIWFKLAGIRHKQQYSIWVAFKNPTCLVTLTTTNVKVKYLYLAATFMLIEQCYWFHHFQSVCIFLKLNCQVTWSTSCQR